MKQLPRNFVKKKKNRPEIGPNPILTGLKMGKLSHSQILNLNVLSETK